MDYFYFFMNSNNKLPPELTCAGGRTSHEVTNYIQTRGSLLPPRLRISRQHSKLSIDAVLIPYVQTTTSGIPIGLYNCGP